MNFVYLRKETVFAKQKLDSKTSISEIWKAKFGNKPIIANAIKLFREIKPNNEKEFFDGYIESAKKHFTQPISERNLTFEEIENIAKQLMDECFKEGTYNFIYEDFLNYVLYEIITKTYDDKLPEIKFAKFLEGLNYKCEFFDDEQVIKYGVNIKVTNIAKNKISAIRIEPVLFFKTKNQDVYYERVHLAKQYLSTLNDLGIKTYYAVFYKAKDKNTILWNRNKNGFRFKIDDLCTFNASDIDNTYKDKKMKDDFDLLLTN